MSDYQITAVAPETRKFETQYGEMISYKIRLEGVQQAVELAQKTTTAPPQVGATLTGTIDMSGQYGPKFKKAPKESGWSGSTGGAQRSTSSKSGGYQPKDDAAIKAMWAIGQAVIINGQTDGVTANLDQSLQATAIMLFHMVDRVKTSTEPTAKPDNEAEALEDIFGADDSWRG